MRPLARPVLNNCADSVAAHARMPGIHKIHGESEILQTLETLFESRLARRYSTEEHVTYYNARVPFLLSLDEGTTSARSALYDEQDRTRGYIEVPDRRGVLHHYPFLSVSIGVASSASRPIRSQWEASAVATEMKAVAKRKLGSSYEIDRRRT